MKSLNALGGLIAAAILCLSVPLFAAIQLVPVVSGLSSPLFVGHAGDGSNRLFIVERGGVIKVLQPGATTPTVFLDIHTRVVAGGEQGLLGLAFHPQYEGNGRFFVYYTQPGDGTLVLAEYHVTSDPNVASTSETRLLTIPHPTNLNHNGGMLAFGPDDGYLYIGVGDGGAGNDPPNNAQSLDELLGKLLRIDVDVPGVPYGSPATNPFVGMANAREEIFAYGLRNPWRFSFDRGSHEMWLADVGQGAIEEVDTPIVRGGNYGWRIFEGNSCTNTDPALCADRSPYIFPIFEYTHSGGRCSITGGYVYRGSQGAVPDGTYVYGDYCSGEILGWNGVTQDMLLDTTMNISSFGEDESGEIYVVNLGGTVSRIASAAPPCTYNINPSQANYTRTGGTGSVAVTAPPGCPWTAASNATWLTITGGSSGTGNGTVAYSVAPYGGPPKKRAGTLTIAGLTFTVNQTK